MCSLLVLLSKLALHRDKIQQTHYSLLKSSQRNQGIFLRWSSVSSENWIFSLSLQAFVFYFQWCLLSLFFLLNSHSFNCSAAHLFLCFPLFTCHFAKVYISFFLISRSFLLTTCLSSESLLFGAFKESLDDICYELNKISVDPTNRIFSQLAQFNLD